MTDKSKDLDSISAIKPDRDDVASYRRGSRADVPGQSNFNGLLVFSLIVMAVMIGVGGFTLFEVQKNLDHSNELLEKSLGSLRLLENELARTGSKSSKTFQSMESQLKTNVSEIDKLWAISHRQNKPKIAELEVKLRRENAERVKLEKQIISIDSKFGNINAAFTTLNSDIANFKENMVEDTTSAVTQLSIVTGQVQDQNDLQEKNRRTIVTLNKSVKELEEAVAVFDRYRRQVNKSLIDLQNEIRDEVLPPIN